MSNRRNPFDDIWFVPLRDEYAINFGIVGTTRFVRRYYTTLAEAITARDQYEQMKGKKA